MTIISEDPITGAYYYDEYSDTVYKTDFSSLSTSKITSAVAGILTFLLFLPTAIVLSCKSQYAFDIALPVMFFASVICALAYVWLQKLYCKRAWKGNGRALISIEISLLQEMEAVRGAGVDMLFLPSAVFQYIILAAVAFLVGMGIIGVNNAKTTIFCTVNCLEIWGMHQIIAKKRSRIFFKKRLYACIEAEKELM